MTRPTFWTDLALVVAAAAVWTYVLLGWLS